MNSNGAIYLSASVPNKGQEGFATADSYLIRCAVIEFIEIVLGRRVIVTKVHHETIQMMKNMAERFNFEPQEYLRLYQSGELKYHFLENKEYLKNAVLVPKVDGDEKASLRKMYELMFAKHDFSAAVFIGGSEGLREEYELFNELNPTAKPVLIPSPGGVARSLFESLDDGPEELENSIDFIYWFCELLDIDFFEARGSNPAVNLLNKQEEDLPSQREQSSKEAPAVSPIEAKKQSETEYSHNMRISDEEIPKSESIYLSVNSFDQSDVDKFEKVDDNAVNSAVAALTDLIIGRRILLWNGNPEITPQISFVAKEYEVDCDRWAKIYKLQSDSEADEHDSVKLGNITHAIFLGGGENTMLEYEQFRKRHPDATIITVPETGGAALKIARKLGQEISGDSDRPDYCSVFSNKLRISPDEERTRLLEDHVVASQLEAMKPEFEERLPAHGVIPSREAAEVPHFFGREPSSPIIHPFSTNK